MNRLVSYMFRGLLLLAPVGLTIWIIVYMFKFLDDAVNDLLAMIIEFVFGVPNFRIPALGVLVLLVLITLIGFFSSTLLLRPLFGLFEQAISKAPFVSIIYTSLKDFVSAFFSDKKKFNQPVVVNVNGNSDFQRLGFITKSDLSIFGLKGKVAVYLPHSYNISGNLFVVDVKDVTPIDVPVAEFMKFIVSGGITEWKGDTQDVKEK